MLTYTENIQMRNDSINSLNSSNRIRLSVKFLGLYFLLMAFDNFSVLGIGSLLRVLALLPIGTVLFVEKNWRLSVSKLVKWVFFYLISLYIPVVYSIDIFMSLSSANRIMVNMILILCMGGLCDGYSKREYEYLIKSLVFGGLLTMGLTFVFSDLSANGRMTIKINGMTQDQNYINGYSFIAVAYFSKLLIKNKKVIAIIPIVINVIFTLMTGSRGALLSLGSIIIATMFYVFLVDHDFKLTTVILVTIFIILFVFSFQYVLALISPQVAARFSLEFIENYNGTKRTDLWGYLLGVYFDSNFFRQLFGYGTGTTVLVNEVYHSVAHDLWLDHLLCNGLFGFLVLIGMQFVMMKKALANRDVRLVSAFVGFLVMSLTLSISAYKPMFNTMMMILILDRLKPEECSVDS